MAVLCEVREANSRPAAKKLTYFVRDTNDQKRVASARRCVTWDAVGLPLFGCRHFKYLQLLSTSEHIWHGKLAGTTNSY
jgi:hypothetical protein